MLGQVMGGCSAAVFFAFRFSRLPEFIGVIF